MIHCKNCIHWKDEGLEQIEADQGIHAHIFMGCRIFGHIAKTDNLPSCTRYEASEDFFIICHSCSLTVPKMCVSLGECANCMDTDLFCIDHCLGGDHRKYCTHFVRLHTEGVHLIDNNEVFDLFPSMGMPGKDSSNGSGTPSKENPPKDSKNE